MNSNAEAQRRRGRTRTKPSLCASAPLREFFFALCLATTFSAGIVFAEEHSTTPDVVTLVGLLELVLEADADSARQCLRTLGERIRSGEIDAATTAELKK